MVEGSPVPTLLPDSPIVTQLLNHTPKKSTLKVSSRRDPEDSHSHSIYEMDPAMASLTQSLEDLDRDLEAPLRPKRSPRTGLSANSNASGLTKSGPGSVPLLASTEDISVIVQNAKPSTKKSPGTEKRDKNDRKIVNPESYSTPV